MLSYRLSVIMAGFSGTAAKYYPASGYRAIAPFGNMAEIICARRQQYLVCFAYYVSVCADCAGVEMASSIVEKRHNVALSEELQCL
jgi:hypothetical protein